MGNQVETSPRQLWSVPVRIELDMALQEPSRLLVWGASPPPQSRSVVLDSDEVIVEQPLLEVATIVSHHQLSCSDLKNLFPMGIPRMVPSTYRDVYTIVRQSNRDTLGLRIDWMPLLTGRQDWLPANS